MCARLIELYCSEYRAILKEGAALSTPVVEGSSTQDSARKLWAELAMGLHIQRVHLHLVEYRTVLSSGGKLPDLPETTFPGSLATRPQETASHGQLTRQNGILDSWIAVPRAYGLADGPANQLFPVARDAAQSLVSLPADHDLQLLIVSLAESTAWWVGYFTIIRHLGVHHSTYTKELAPLSLEALHLATTVVTVGMLTRTLEQHLRHNGLSDPFVRTAYCAALDSSVALEKKIPALIEEIQELRLVDLVTTSIPWRGQFYKYSGGTGAGQVE